MFFAILKNLNQVVQDKEFVQKLISESQEGCDFCKYSNLTVSEYEPHDDFKCNALKRPKRSGGGWKGGQRVEKYSKVWQSVAKCGKVRQSVAKFGKVW